MKFTILTRAARLLPEPLLDSMRRSKSDVAKILCAAVALGLAYALTAPPYFVSEAKILPPKQVGQDFLMTMGMVGNFDMGTNLFRDPNQTYAAILTSRTLALEAVDSFRMVRVYKKKNRTRAAREFKDRLAVKVNSKDGVISVGYRDLDPERSRAIVQFCIDHFTSRLETFHRLESEKKERILRQRLDQVASEIGNANRVLSDAQGTLGITLPDKQVEAYAQSAEKMNLLLTEKRMQLASLRLGLGEENPVIQSLKNEIASLEDLGRGARVTQKKSRDFVAIDSLLRKKLILQATFEALIKQVELTNLSKSKSDVEIQILEYPVASEEKDGPNRKLILALSLFVGLGLSGIVLLARLPKNAWRN